MVGTGGRSLYPISTPDRQHGSYNDDTFGVLELTLHPKKILVGVCPCGGPELWATPEAPDATERRRLPFSCDRSRRHLWPGAFRPTMMRAWA